MRPTRPTSVALAVATLLLSACTPSADSPTTPTASLPTSPAPSASAEPSATPTPSSTLTPAQQQAFDEAVNVALAYRQTIVDLYSGARNDPNDLYNVAVGKVRDEALIDVPKAVAQGYYTEPRGAELVLVSSEPVEVNLKKDPNTVVLRACIDATAGTVVAPDGTKTQGDRDLLEYTVIRTESLPAPGWAVSRVMGEADLEDRTC